MEVILTSVFSAIIILITVFFMVKVFIIAYKRKEISLRKFIILSVSSIVIGVIVASVLPFGYQKIYQYF
jgi:FtsH-binding integral membrane protein